MRILLVAIPNHHFFQWVNQLEAIGNEVVWFDITDGGTAVERIKWVKQIKGWKLQWNFPFRQTVKKYAPKLYSYLQQFNEKKVDVVFDRLIKTFQPHCIHVFEMKLAGIPILGVLENYKFIPLFYSSWGSDLFYYSQLGVNQSDVFKFLKRVDYLVTDCHRDYFLAKEDGFKNVFLGVFPGNGGISIDIDKIKDFGSRDSIIIKGYDDGVGLASNVLYALKQVPFNLIQNYTIIVYSADLSLVQILKKDPFFKDFKFEIIKRGDFISNPELLERMGHAILHIGNSISDGMPNALLEAMGMGAFPIQSNPGGVSEEVITHGINGFLIQDPYDISEIASCIKKALENYSLRAQAQEYNIAFVQENYNRDLIRPKILALYELIKNNKRK